MECRPAENLVACFERLERENNISHYYFILPANAKMHGTTFEAGMLSRDFKYGQYSHIVAFIDESLAVRDAHGELVHRFQKNELTNYLGAMLDLTPAVRWWKSIEHLIDQVGMQACTLLDDISPDDTA
jgi:hypothetical protein